MDRSGNSLSQQSIKSSGNENMLNFSSDIDSNTKRNSWWKKLSYNRRQSLNINKSNRLNADSNAESDGDSQWWKNLSENEQLSIQLKNINETENNKSLEKQISQLERDESDNENFVPKKSIFASQEVQSQKSRYSHAFNLKPEKSIQENEQPLELDLEYKNINSIEEPEAEGTKKNKKRKTKTLFKKIDKRRKYSDIFISPNIESQETEQNTHNDVNTAENVFTEQTIQKNNNEEDFDTENIRTKESLFKISQNKKKYSEAFDLGNTESMNQNNDHQKESSIIEENIAQAAAEKKKLFQINQKKNKLSEFSSDEEIFSSSGSNHSLSRKSNNDVFKNKNLNPQSEKNKTAKLSKNDDSYYSQLNDLPEESLNEENVAEKKQLFQINQKKKKYSEAFAVSKNITSVNSDSENCEEEVLTQKDASTGNTRSLRNRKSNTSVSKNKNLNRQSDKNKTAEFLDSKNDFPEESLNEENIAAEKKQLFQINLKKKKYSEAFAVSKNITSVNSDSENSEEEVLTQKDASVGSTRSLRNRKSNTSVSKNKNLNRQSDKNKTAEFLDSKNDFPEESLNEENIAVEKKQLFQINQKKKKYSEAFAVSKNILLDSKNSEEEIIEEMPAEKDTSVGSTRSLRNRKINTSVSKNKNLSRQSDKNKTAEFSKLNKNDDSKNDLLDESLNEENVATEKKQLFQINQKKKKYSEAFAVSKNILLDSKNSEEEMLVEKDTSVGSTRSLRNRKINTSVSKNKNLSRQSDKNKTAEFSKLNENDLLDESLNEENVATEKKKLFQINLKKKKYSEAFAVSKNILLDSKNSEEVIIEEVLTQKDTSVGSTRSLRNRKSNTSVSKNKNLSRQSDKNKTAEFLKLNENDLLDESLNEENVATEKKKLFQINLKKKKYSEAFAVSKNILLDSKNSEEEIIEEVLTQKDTSVGSTRSLRNRKSNTSVSKNKNLSRQSDKNKTAEFSKLNENDLLDESLNEENGATEKKQLFQINQKKKKYSEAFAVSKNILLDSKNSEEEIIEEVLTQKDTSVGSTRSLRNRKSNTSISKNKNLSHQSDKNKTAEFSKLKKNDDSKNDLSDESLNEENVTIEKKQLFQINQEKKKYSEAFAVSKNMRLVNSDSENSEEEVITQKDASVGSTRSLRNRKSDTSVSKNKNLSQQSDKNKTAEFSKLNKNDGSENNRNKTPQENINLNRQSAKSTISNSSKKENTTPSNRSIRSNKNVQNSIAEKGREVEVSEPEDEIKSKGLFIFQAKKKDRKYSEAFLNVTRNSQKSMDIAENNLEQEQENDLHNKNKENQTRPTIQKIISNREESSRKNSKCSEAFMELIAMQRPIEDFKLPSEFEANDDTSIPSISSIDISDEIKHPIFKPNARKSLYSVKEQKSVARTKISTNRDEKTKKISQKRMSLRSTSPTDSLISKFFEESLISSTKLFINPNGEKSGGSDRSTKKKRRQSIISNIKETNEVNVESETNQDKHVENIQKNKTLIEPETQERESPNYNKISNIAEVVVPAKEISKTTRNSKSSISSSSNLENIAKNKTDSNVLNEIDEINGKSPSLNRFSQNSIKSLIHRNSQSSIKNSETSKKSASQKGMQPNVTIPEENVNILRSISIKESASNDGINNLPENYNKSVQNTQSSPNKKNTILEVTSEHSEKTVNEQPKSAKEKNKIYRSKSKTNYSLSTELLDPSSLSGDEDPYVKDLIKSQSSTRKTNSSSQKPIELSSNNVISIRSTDAHEKLNSSQRIENWLSKSVMANNDQFENENQESVPNVDFMSTIRKSTIFSGYRETMTTLNERQILDRKKLLKKCAEEIAKENKEKKNVPNVPDKKITDFFKRLDAEEKLKPIPKSTNKIKKVSRPVCTARLVDGKPYYSRKLFRGERWCTPRFYKFLKDKIKEECQENTTNESENIMKNIVTHVRTILKSKKYMKEEVEKFKIELAQRNIVSTIYDFYRFCFDYLPREYRDKVVPYTQAHTSEPTVPCPDPTNIFKPIL